MERLSNLVKYFRSMEHNLWYNLKVIIRRVSVCRLPGSKVIVCGLGEKGLHFVSQFLKEGRRVTVIEIDKNNPYIDRCRDMGARVIIGPAEEVTKLKRAGIDKAERLMCLCSSDGVNAEISIRARSLIPSSRNKRLICLVHLFSAPLSMLLRARTIELDKKNSFSIEFFNIYQTAAWKMLNLAPKFNDHESVSGPTPRIIVIGLGRLGENLVAQAAKRWRTHCSNPNRRMRITIIDKQAKRKTSALCLRYPKLNKIARLGVLDMDVESQQFHIARFLEDPDERSNLRAIYICFDNQTLALTAGLNLAARTQGRDLTIVVRMAQESGLASLIGAYDSTAQGKPSLTAFGVLDRTCVTNLEQYYTINIVAKALHHDVANSLRRNSDDDEKENILRPWEELPQGCRESFLQEAAALYEKLSSVGCLIAPQTNWDAELFQFTHEELDEIGATEEDQRVYVEAPESFKMETKEDAGPDSHCYPQKRGHLMNLDDAKSIPRILASVDLEIYRLDELGVISNRRFH